MAESLLTDESLPEEIRQLLTGNPSAFLLGHVAPDVQVVLGQKRKETHFFRLPVAENDTTPWEKIYQTYPELTPARVGSSTHAAFIAGYFCHLQADWAWAIEVFEPIFGRDATWGQRRKRLYLHNVLRSYLELQVLEHLNGFTRQGLEQAVIKNWLPFTQDKHLRTWQGFLVDQLKPGAKIRTVEVFASRQGISPADYYKLLDSEQNLETEIFSHLPRSRLDTYRNEVIQENIVFLKNYLSVNVFCGMFFEINFVGFTAILV